MEKYHIVSGDIRFCCQAENLVDAFISTLRSFPITKFGQFISGYIEQDGEDNASWGMTEWYLEKAGYEPVGNGLYRWRKDPNENSKRQNCQVEKNHPRDTTKMVTNGSQNTATVWVITASLSRIEAEEFAKTCPPGEYYLLKTHENKKARHIAKRERFVLCRLPHKNEKIPDGFAKKIDLSKLEKLT